MCVLVGARERVFARVFLSSSECCSSCECFCTCVCASVVRVCSVSECVLLLRDACVESVCACVC